MYQMLKKVIALTLCVCLLVSLLVIDASAANACYNVGGTSNGATTFTAETNGWWLTNGKITLKQSTGTAVKDSYKGGGSYSTYSYYTIKVTAKGYSKTYSMTGKSKTITLPKRNTTYKISVSPGNRATMRIKMGSKNRWFSSWRTPSKWSASSTKHVSFCY